MGVVFRFRRDSAIGEPDAESDERYLSECFIDTGDFEVLQDLAAPQRIVIGRTGAGKSALIKHLIRVGDNVINIAPENLALTYISNSDILSVLEKAGVKLDIFYTLLWKHVFAVELLRYRYDLSNEEKTTGWCATFLARFQRTDKVRQRALEYLRDWGDKFWQETEYRIKEVTHKLESEVAADVGMSIAELKNTLQSKSKESEERRFEIINKAQTVVNRIQVKALSDVISFLAEEVFDDSKRKHYIVVDRLDEDWVDDNLRYRLIRALIETVKSFRVVSNVKIIVAIRLDLLRTVFDRTRDAGFQEEKYQSLLLRLQWDKSSILKMLDSRVSKLVREQYTLRPVHLEDLFPDQVGNVPFTDYLVQRTLNRPRDAIAFINECLRRAENKGRVTTQTIKEAEVEYSAGRLEALCYEWFAHYPLLVKYFEIIEKMPMSFKLHALAKERIDDFCFRNCVESPNLLDPVVRAGVRYLNGSDNNQHPVVISLVKALYEIGVVGIKTDSFTSQIWSYRDTRSPSDGQIKPSSEIYIHPMLWSRCGIVPRADERRSKR